VAFIELKDAGIDFPVYGASSRSFRHALFKKRTGGVAKEHAGSITVTALQNMTFSLRSGDRLGLIGHNGAGKSTLLRMLAGVYEPTSGNLQMSGRVSALFNPLLGMDPDDSAIENIFTVSMFFGMTPKEISRKVDDIAQFSELGEFLYLPVRTYSTGMQLRLAFALATSIDPEILLLDEGIGMGDARFAEKAQQRMDSLLNRTEILVVASHSDSLIQQMCNKALLLEEGRPIFVGDVDTALERYHHPDVSVA